VTPGDGKAGENGVSLSLANYLQRLFALAIENRGIQQSRAVTNCQKLHLFVLDPIDDPIATHQNLPNILSANLWHNSTQPRETAQPIRRLHHSIREGCRHLRRVARNEQANRFQVFVSLRGPS
jgi:hypothetical protein